MTLDDKAPSAIGGNEAAPPGPEPAPAARAKRRERVRAGIAGLIEAINRSDDKAVEQAVLQLSNRSRWLAPLALIVGAFLMLFQGLKLLVTNWRLTLVQIVPAMWIWAAMLDIKIHLLHGKEFHILRGAILVPAVLGVIAITAASFYLNGVFAFAISKPGKPEIRPAFGQANRHLRVILPWGCLIGFALAFSSLVVTRWGHWPFAICQSIVVGLMMLLYVAVPARIVGIEKSKNTPRRARRHGCRRCRRGGRVLTALHAGPTGDPHVGLALPVLAGHHPDRHRGHAADGRDQRSEGGQVLGQARRHAGQDPGALGLADGELTGH